MKSVCLISPSSPFLIDDKVFPPLGLLYIGRELKDRGIPVVVHDGPTKDIPEGYDVYGISVTTPQFPQAQEILQHIRQFPGKPSVVIGGPHATIDPDSCLSAGFDTVVLQAGESSLPIVMEHGCRIIDTPIVNRKHPDRSLINLKNYHYDIDGRPATSIMTTRGCPYQCGFCCKINKRVKVSSAEFVLEELRELRDVYGYKAFMFFDDLFIVDPHRFMVIANEIKKWDVFWRGFVRADLVVKHGPDFAKLMAESGCKEVGMGIETGSNKILKSINKGEDADTLKRGISIMRNAGIRVKGFLIVGLPGESPETIDETKSFIESSGLSDVDFSIFTPYKKTTIYDNKENFDIFWDKIDLQKSWYKGDDSKDGGYSSQVWTSAMSKQDIVDARRMLENTFKNWKK